MKKTNKRTTWIALLMALVMLIGAKDSFAAESRLNETQAVRVALEDAGLDESETDRIRTESDREDGQTVYEITIRAGGTEYEYTLAAESGEILEREIERRPVEGGAPVNLEEAKAIALASVGCGEDEVLFSKARQEKEDGRQVFDIEFFVEDVAEYGFEIDVETGMILKESYERWDAESERSYRRHSGTETKSSGKSSADGSETISAEEAQDIALDQAGRSRDEVVFSKTKLERDDGRLQYEVEFFVRGESEYEFEIDAVTGEVLSFEHESWDE